MPIRRYLDVVVVAIAAIPALALGAPVFGYVMGAGAWIVQRAIQANEYRLTARIADPTRAVGARLFGAGRHQRKRALILEAQPHRYDAALSDISGQDIDTHDCETRHDLASHARAL